MELVNDQMYRNNSTIYVEETSEVIETQGDMYQIHENDEELNNSFENIRKSTFKGKPKSLDDFDGEEEEDQ